MTWTFIGMLAALCVAAALFLWLLIHLATAGESDDD